jgi:hypothetical protein
MTLDVTILVQTLSQSSLILVKKIDPVVVVILFCSVNKYAIAIKLYISGLKKAPMKL